MLFHANADQQPAIGTARYRDPALGGDAAPDQVLGAPSALA
jgi:hypothetical protein